MRGQDNRINVAILAVPEVTASALFGMFDLFSSPGRDWSFIVTGQAGKQRMHPYVVARSTDGFAAANGIWVKPDYGFSGCPSPDIVCIPDFFVNPGKSVAGMYEPEASWLKQSHDDGAMLASACSGAVLLGEAGLLVNCEATIHWGYVATLTNNYPGVKVSVNRSLVLSGEAQRIVMAGGGSSWQDLALYLIARFVGLEEAMEVAKVYMLQWHDMGQQPFASLCEPPADDGCGDQQMPGVAGDELQGSEPGRHDGCPFWPSGTLVHPPLHQGRRHEAAQLRARAASRGSQTSAGNNRSADRSHRQRNGIRGCKLLQPPFSTRNGPDPGPLSSAFCSLRRAPAKHI